MALTYKTHETLRSQTTFESINMSMLSVIVLLQTLGPKQESFIIFPTNLDQLVQMTLAQHNITLSG